MRAADQFLHIMYPAIFYKNIPTSNAAQAAIAKYTAAVHDDIRRTMISNAIGIC